LSFGRQSPSSGQRSSGWRNASGISKPGWGSIQATRPGLRRPTCRARPSARHPGPGAGDAVANPVTSPTSGPLRHADDRGDLSDARHAPVRLPGQGMHREHGRPCRPPAPPHSRLTLGSPGRGRTSHQLRVPNRPP